MKRAPRPPARQRQSGSDRLRAYLSPECMRLLAEIEALQRKLFTIERREDASINPKEDQEMSKRTSRQIAQLLARHVRQGERARSQFKKSGSALDRAIALGAPINTPIEIELREGRERVTRRVVIRDQFETKNTAFAAKVFQRYAIVDYKGSAPGSGAGFGGSPKPSSESEAA